MSDTMRSATVHAPPRYSCTWGRGHSAYLRTDFQRASDRKGENAEQRDFVRADKRRELMEIWSDFAARPSAQVIPLSA